MPLTPDEERRLKKAEDDAERGLQTARAAKKHAEEIESRLDRGLDEKRHEWQGMVDGAKVVLTAAFKGELERLRPRFDQLDQILAINSAQNETLEDLRSELGAARDERVARKAREAAAAEAITRDEVTRAARQAERDHRLKVWGVVIGVLTIVAGLASAAIASHH